MASIISTFIVGDVNELEEDNIDADIELTFDTMLPVLLSTSKKMRQTSSQRSPKDEKEANMKHKGIYSPMQEIVEDGVYKDNMWRRLLNYEHLGTEISSVTNT
eukprot:840750-Ditylum_brightwellii.AAC.1